MKSRQVHAAWTSPAVNVPGGRRTARTGRATEVWIPAKRQVWGHPGRRGPRPRTRRKRGQRASQRGRCHRQTCLSTPLRPHTACVNKCRTAKWLAVIMMSVQSSGSTFPAWDCITSPKWSGSVPSVGGRMRRPWTRPWRGLKRRKPTTGSYFVWAFGQSVVLSVLCLLYFSTPIYYQCCWMAKVTNWKREGRLDKCYFCTSEVAIQWLKLFSLWSSSYV